MHDRVDGGRWVRAMQHNGLVTTACAMVQLQDNGRALTQEITEASVDHGTQEVLLGKATL